MGARVGGDVLLGFRVTNHRSFRDEQELSLLPVFDKTRPALPVAGVFGANASGKSSLLDGLTFARDAVVYSYVGWDPLGGVPRRPFRLDAGSAANPSTFAVDFVVDGARYLYGFSVDDASVVEEWLYCSPHGRRRVLYERVGMSVRFGPTFEGPRQPVVELMRANSLLLSTAAQAGHVSLAPLFSWFRSSVAFIDARAYQPFTAVLGSVGTRDRARLLHRVAALVRGAGLGIADVRVRADGPESGGGGLPRLVFLHETDGGTVEMDESEEAHGTLRWVTLLLPVVAALEAGSVLAIDEIDVSLHPYLTRQLVRLFRDAATNPAQAQLIFASHDSTLLGTVDGAAALGPDEVWFVEKDKSGASALYPLSDFRLGGKDDIERRYLQGHYGAVPLVGSA